MSKTWMIVALGLTAGTGWMRPAEAQPVGRWDTERLRRGPKTFEPPAGIEAKGLRAIWYEGEPYRGKQTRVFAWYGAPQVKPGTKVPAMVLVHGGGGTAVAKWVRLWVRRGYAAIAMDTCGALPKKDVTAKGRRKPWMRTEFSGPPGWGGFDQVDDPPTDQWTHHAVAAVVRGHSLIRSLPEVDPKRVGITGISWGGWLTCIVAGVDQRFGVAVPVYGCGFTAVDSKWYKTFDKIGPARTAKWTRLWDPSNYLPRATMPICWVTRPTDSAYRLGVLQQSYRLVRSPVTLCVRVNMRHGHAPGWSAPEPAVVADSHFRKAPPLAKITGQGRLGSKVWATFQAGAAIVKAELCFTKSVGEWPKRKWAVASARLESKATKAVADLPEGTTVYFMNVIDDRGCVVSTPHEVVDPAGVVPLTQVH